MILDSMQCCNYALGLLLLFIKFTLCTHSLPRPIAGEVSALLLTRHLNFEKKRAEHALGIMANAYWSNTLAPTAIKECLADVKFLPPVQPLLIDSLPAATLIPSNSDSDDSVHSDTICNIDEIDTDSDSDLDSYASSDSIITNVL